MCKKHVLRRFLRIWAVQKVIRDPTQLSGRGLFRIFYMKLFLSQFYIFLDTHVVSKLSDVDPHIFKILKVRNFELSQFINCEVAEFQYFEILTFQKFELSQFQRLIFADVQRFSGRHLTVLTQHVCPKPIKL